MTEQKIADFLKHQRRSTGFSANQVVSQLKVYNIDISSKTLYGYESGLSMPNADVFVALCKIYKCDNLMNAFGNISMRPEEISFIEKYRKLDKHGREMVDFTLRKEWERSTRIYNVKEYKIASSEPSLFSMAAEESTYGVKAAHERTDIKITDEMRKHDDDIMNNDNF